MSMLRDYLAATGLGGAHLAAMVLFLMVFVAVTAYTFFDRGAKRRMDRAALLPFEDGERPGADAARQGGAR
jgi:cbb3-type cytochrome oxidase subunit 3